MHESGHRETTINNWDYRIILVGGCLPMWSMDTPFKWHVCNQTQRDTQTQVGYTCCGHVCNFSTKLNIVLRPYKNLKILNLKNTRFSLFLFLYSLLFCIDSLWFFFCNFSPKPTRLKRENPTIPTKQKAHKHVTVTVGGRKRVMVKECLSLEGLRICEGND